MFCITIEHKSSCNNFFDILLKLDKLPFSLLWTCLATFIKSRWLTQKIETSTHSSFQGYCKDIANLLLWVLWECLIITITMSFTFSWSCLSHCRKYWCPKWWNQLLGNFDVYLPQKSQLHLYLFRDIVKTLQTWFFGNFGNAWPYPSKNLIINL